MAERESLEALQLQQNQKPHSEVQNDNNLELEEGEVEDEEEEEEDEEEEEESQLSELQQLPDSQHVELSTSQVEELKESQLEGLVAAPSTQILSENHQCVGRFSFGKSVFSSFRFGLFESDRW